VFKRILPITLLGYLCVVTTNWGCSKLDTTTLGSDLIPAVDNVNTFSTTLDIETTQGEFTDSFKILRAENHALGYISGDPLFGQTEASVFVQLKPSFYPFNFGNAGDTLLGVDSVVLCLAYTGASWGDTSAAAEQILNVFQVNDQNFANDIFKFRTVSTPTDVFPTVLGSSRVIIRKLKDTIKIANGKDSLINQIRIKLNSSFATQLWGDTGIGRPLYSDSLFRKAYNGFAIKAGGSSANALMYVSLTDAKTRLEVHYKKKTKGTGFEDTTSTSFVISTADNATMLPSASYNYIKRTHNPFTDPNALYLQTGPGTFANLKIKGLDTLALMNRIVHRAQISVEQIPDLANPMLDSIFSVPSYLYLDLIDSVTPAKWKPLYYDLNPATTYDPDNKTGFPYFPGTGVIDYGYFGGFARKRVNAVGEKVYYYDLNVTRYLQQIVTRKTRLYDMRLFAGFRTQYPQYGNVASPTTPISLDNPLAYGRIKVKSGAYPDPKVKMRMTIIWSKVNQ
jgi:Domain of unknown function (DUF4270)